LGIEHRSCVPIGLPRRVAAMPRRQRLDQLLLARELAASRQQAQSLIRAGRVRSGSRILDKPGMAVREDLALLVDHPPRYVSRGGEKLAAALTALPIRVEGRVCLDAGISTGGFTDCLLQHGARRVVGVDVGYGQTAWSLRTDPRVKLRERTNLRHLEPLDLYAEGEEWPDLAVADLSFISLRQVLPALRRLLLEPAEALVLVKPQFEVGRERVGKGGVVRDPAAQVDAVLGVIEAAGALHWQPHGLVASPLRGAAGNQEYLLWLRDPGDTTADSSGWSHAEGRVSAVVRQALAGASGESSGGRA
jgi:23S rRNA (cytidine1920-2'-O)/16S rRNA (cytidine1409-2'-O)-methyltransferase